MLCAVLEARRKTYTFSTTKLDVVKSIYEDIDAYVKDSKRHLDDLLENLNAPILRPAKFREIPAAREEEYYPLIKEHLEREGRRLQQVSFNSLWLLMRLNKAQFRWGF